MSSALAFQTTRAFRPMVNGKPGVPLVAVEHWNGLDKLTDGAGRVLIVKFLRGEGIAQAMHDVLGITDDSGNRAHIVCGTSDLLAELGLTPAWLPS